MRELNKNAWVFEMTVDESCKNIDDIEDIIRQSNGTIIGLRGRNHTALVRAWAKQLSIRFVALFPE